MQKYLRVTAQITQHGRALSWVCRGWFSPESLQAGWALTERHLEHASLLSCRFIPPGCDFVLVYQPPPTPQKNTTVLPKQTRNRWSSIPALNGEDLRVPGRCSGVGGGGGCRLLSGAVLPPTVCQAVCTGGEPERQGSETRVAPFPCCHPEPAALQA